MTSPSSARCFALRLIASGEVPVKDLITHRLKLDQVHEALDAVASGEAIKVTIEPWRLSRWGAF